MILSLKIKNFLSFKEEVLINFEATKDKHLDKFHVAEVSPGVRISKLAIVYGANASGKSNLIEAFEFLQNFWFNSTVSKDDEIDVIPFLLDTKSKEKPSEFVLTFYVGKIKHIYTLILNKKYVLEESLFQYLSFQPTEIFTRTLNQNVSELYFNPKLKISAVVKEEILVKCLTNMSFFAAFNKVNIHQQDLENVVFWMKTNIMSPVEPKTNLTSYVERLLLKDENIKSSILNFLHEADFNICKINTELTDEPVTDDFINKVLKSNLPIKEKERLKKERTFNFTKTLFTHKILNNNGMEESYDLPEELQSEGTLRTMGLAGVIKQAINKNAFLAIDEIESSLHPKLIEFLITNFLKLSNNSQLLLTTHYDGLLGEDDLLRNDNIWFSNKKKDGSTELYSLSDFKGVNRINSLQKAYKFGKFGAVPNI